jgi:hypothetical protein
MKYLIFLLLTTIGHSQIILNSNRANVINPPISEGGSGYTSGVDYVWTTDSVGVVDTLWESVSNDWWIFNYNTPPTNTDTGLVFTNSGAEYLRRANPPSSMGDSLMTIEMVIKVTSISTTQFYFGFRVSGDMSFGIGMNSDGTWDVCVFKSRWQMMGDTQEFNATATLGWHYVVATYDGSATDAGIHFNIDGVSVSDVGNVRYAGLVGDNRITLGASGGSGNAMADNTLISYVAVRTELLNSTQSSNNFNSPTIQNNIPAWAR